MPKVGASNQVFENDNYTYIHEGNLVVESGEDFILKNEHLIVNGNVIIEENSRLVIENSHLKIFQQYKSQYSLRVLGGSVEIENSTVEPFKGIHEGKKWFFTCLMIGLEGGSLRVKDSEIRGRICPASSSDCIIEDSRVAFLNWVPTSDVKVSNSVIAFFAFNLKEYTGSGDLVLEDLRPRKKLNFTLMTDDGGSIALENTLILNSWSVNFEFTKKEVTIKNSDIGNLWVKFPPTKHRITIDLGHGYFQHFSLEENILDVDLSYNVILENTSINYFKPEMFGTKAKFTNIYAMIHPYEKSDLIFENSTILVANIYGAERLEFVNSTIIQSLKLIHKPEFSNGYTVKGVEIGAGGTGLLIFEDTVIDVNEISVACKNYTIHGSVKIRRPSSYERVYWSRGTVNRKYPVYVKSPQGMPYNDSLVTLIDNENRLIWSGRTNENGYTSFNIAFNENNFTDEWTAVLKIPRGDRIKKKVGFLTDAPIDLCPFPNSSLALKLISKKYNYIKKYLVWLDNIDKEYNDTEVTNLLLKFKTTLSKENYLKAKSILDIINSEILFQIDGRSDDWTGIEPNIRDKKGDTRVDYGDIKSINAEMNDKYLYVVVELYDKNVVNAASKCLLWIDNNCDGTRDYSFDIENEVYKQGFENGVNNCIEYKIPLTILGNPEIFDVGLHIIYKTPRGDYKVTDDLSPDRIRMNRNSIIKTKKPSTGLIIGETAKISGYINPPHENVPVNVTLRKPEGEVLTKLYYTTLEGEFHDSIKLDEEGTWELKAGWNGDLDHNGDETNWITFYPTPFKEALKTENLTIKRDIVQPGETIHVLFNATNKEDFPGNATFVLLLNGTEIASQTTSFNAKESKTIKFQTTTPKHGTYILQVADLNLPLNILQNKRFPITLIAIFISLICVIIFLTYQKISSQ